MYLVVVKLSELKGRLDRASEKEQQSWDLLKQAVENGGSGSAVDEGHYIVNMVHPPLEFSRYPRLRLCRMPCTHGDIMTGFRP